MPLDLEAVIEYQGAPAAQVWDSLVGTHPTLIQPDAECDLYGTRMLASRVSAAIRRARRPDFYVEFSSDSLRYAAVGNHDLSFVEVGGWVTDDDDASNWLAPLLSMSCFVQARVYDKEYEFWQNASDPLQYEVRGRSLEGVKTFMNQNLNYVFVDTSTNPGRRVLREGYIEALGHLMWLSPKFWEKVGRSISVVESSGLCSSISKLGDVDVLRFADKPFTSSKGEEGMFQDRLRALLFPQSELPSPG